LYKNSLEGICDRKGWFINLSQLFCVKMKHWHWYINTYILYSQFFILCVYKMLEDDQKPDDEKLKDDQKSVDQESSNQKSTNDLRALLKPELVEDPKIKPILEYHAERIIEIINQDVITYEKFKRLANVIFKESKIFSEKWPFAYEQEMESLYNQYRLFKRFFNDEERAEKLIKALRTLRDNKRFHVNEKVDETEDSK